MKIGRVLAVFALISVALTGCYDYDQAVQDSELLMRKQTNDQLRKYAELLVAGLKKVQTTGKFTPAKQLRRDRNPEYPLLGLAALSNQPQVVQLLLDKGIVAATPPDDTVMAFRMLFQGQDGDKAEVLAQMLALKLPLSLPYEPEQAAITAPADVILEPLQNNHIQDFAALVKNFKADTILSDGTTLLFHAAAKDTPDFVKILLTQNVNVNKANLRDGKTALMQAATVETVELLRQSGADFNAVDQAGNTALFYAVARNQSDLAGALIDGGALLADQGEKLYQAATTVPMLQTLLTRGADIKLSDPASCYPDPKYREKFNFLVDNGAGLTKPGLPKTLLYLAVEQNDETTVAKLLQHGALVNEANPDGDTPLALAVRNDAVPIAKILLKKGANFALKNAQGRSLFYQAYAARKLLMARVLLLHGAKDTPDEPTLFMATIFDDQDTIAHLIRNGANLNVQKNGVTLFEFAIRHERPEIVKMLLVQKIDLPQRFADGTTPVEYAVKSGDDELAVKLLKAGSPRDSKLFALAANAGLPQTVEYLWLAQPAQ